MRARFVTIGLLCMTLGLSVAAGQGAQDEAAPYLGEWAVTLHDTGSTFEACWLEFERKDGKLDARMLWRWGSVTGVKSVKIVNGEMQWVRPEFWEEKGKSFDTTYHAKLEDGKLVGWVKMPWGELHRFTGVASVDKVDIAGTWICIADDDSEQIERAVALKQDGDEITGTYDDGMTKAEVKNAKLDGNNLAFEISGEDFFVRCKATVEGDRLRGTYVLGTEPGTFSGKRRRTLGEKIVLFDGKDFAGWHSRDPKRAEPKWAIRDGYMYPLSGGTDIVTDQKFQDFIVHVEYCFPKPHGNSGVYVRGRYEVQALDDYGKGLSEHGCGSIYSRVSPTKNITKPQGTWQSLDITLVGHWITVRHNGETIVENAYLEGITGGALDADDNAPGPIMLQAHGEAVQFRNVVITPLLK